MSGVFLLCMSVLMIQIVQTRILSVVSLYYMAFFSISMAMLGLTGGALQIGALEANGLPVAGIETAKKLLDESLPSNRLMKKWADSTSR